MSTLRELIMELRLVEREDSGSTRGPGSARAETLAKQIEHQLSVMVDITDAELFSTWYQITTDSNGDAHWMTSSDPEEILDEHRAMRRPHKLWRQRRYLVWGSQERWTDAEAP